MAEPVDIPPSDLLLNTRNPRFRNPASTQQEAMLELARLQGDSLVNIAKDIVEKGLDPLSLTAVVATGDRRQRYRVLEGNRRLLAIRALETPAIVQPALSPGANKRLADLSARYEQDPIDTVPCALFEKEQDALWWIELRHTGPNQGIGLLGWDPAEKARFKEQHSGRPNLARQVVEFVEASGLLSDEAKESTKGITTNIERLMETSAVREKIGLGLVQGELVSYFPATEIAKPLARMVEDLKTGAIGVPQLYHAGDRRDYVEKFPRSALPKSSSRTQAPVRLDDLSAGVTTPVSTKPRTKKKRATTRTTVIPKTVELDVTLPRINRIYNELLTLTAEAYPNACSVLLRVFIELSVDHYVSDKKLLATDKELREANFAKKLRMVATDLEGRGEISAKIRAAVETFASSRMVGPTIFTLHQYVHNEYVFPKTTDLYSGWDEIEPLLAKVWPPT